MSLCHLNNGVCTVGYNIGLSIDIFGVALTRYQKSFIVIIYLFEYSVSFIYTAIQLVAHLLDEPRLFEPRLLPI